MAMKVRFGPFTLDAAARQLRRGEHEVRLSPKAFDLLVLLVERRPSVVDKATLRERLWPATHVVDASLSNLVAEIRAAVGDGVPSPIRTAHGIGYAFAAELETADEPGGRAGAALFWVVWRERPIPLAAGENLVGRDASCAVWMNEIGVSRRHARIHVPAEGSGDTAVTIEDLASTNGTYVRGRPVRNVTPLRDGDRLQIGPETLLFRSRSGTDAPTRRVRKRPAP